MVGNSQDRKTAEEGATTQGGSPARLTDARIGELDGWRGKTLSRVRALIKQADPKVVEEWKWRGVPVWSHDGIICTGETYKSVVKLTFAKGASLGDPSGLFNATLAARDAAAASGMAQGGAESYERLDELLTTLRSAK